MWFLLTLGLLVAADDVPAVKVDAKPSAPAAKAETAQPDLPAGKEPAGKDAAKQTADDAKSPGKPSDQAAAEETEAEPPAGKQFAEIFEDIMNSGAMGEMRRGGFFMWPILILGIVAAGVVIERWRSLKMLATDTSDLRNEVTQLLREDRVEEALAKSDAQQGPVPAVLSAGLRKFLVLRRLNYDAARIEEQVVKAMDDYGVHIVAALERHLPILATVSSAAPMLGFLGTVQGMVISFREIVARMGETNIVEAAANGINIALLTTVFGLIVGIPSYIAYNYFTSVINRYVLDVEESATDLIEAVTLQMAIRRQETS